MYEAFHSNFPLFSYGLTWHSFIWSMFTVQNMASTEVNQPYAAAFLCPSSEQWEVQGYVWSGLLKQQFLLQMHLPFCWMLHVSVTLLPFRLLQQQQRNVILYRLYNVWLCACLIKQPTSTTWASICTVAYLRFLRMSFCIRLAFLGH